MKTQTTLHISIPDEEVDLYNEIHRVSAITYTPKSMLARRLIRDGLKQMTEKQKLSPAY